MQSLKSKVLVKAKGDHVQRRDTEEAQGVARVVHQEEKPESIQDLKRSISTCGRHQAGIELLKNGRGEGLDIVEIRKIEAANRLQAMSDEVNNGLM